MTAEPSAFQRLIAALESRFGEVPAPAQVEQADQLNLLASHAVTRSFTDRPVEAELVALLCACALSAPSKSDLQQRDIIVISDPSIRAQIDDLLSVDWARRAPAMVMISANGRRLQQIAEWREKPFPNNHFDLLFNAVGDAAICLGWLQIAVEIAGLGGCPLSIVRDHAQAVSKILNLPEGVIPFAGFCLGWPARNTRISPRLPLSMTLHNSLYNEATTRSGIDTYDRNRAAVQPFRHQRDTSVYGETEFYGWSEDKARQYASPLRADFGAYVRKAGFRLD